jgi:hypothetical protein
MKTGVGSLARLAPVLLIVISSTGAVLAVIEFLTLNVLDEVLLSQQTLQESFLVAIKSKLAATEVDIKSVEEEFGALKVIHRSLVEVRSQIQVFEVIAVLLWVLVFAISATILVLQRNRDTRD